jgi:hypothetical protein
MNEIITEDHYKAALLYIGKGHYSSLEKSAEQVVSVVETAKEMAYVVAKYFSEEEIGTTLKMISTDPLLIKLNQLNDNPQVVKAKRSIHEALTGFYQLAFGSIREDVAVNPGIPKIRDDDDYRRVAMDFLSEHQIVEKKTAYHHWIGSLLLRRHEEVFKQDDLPDDEIQEKMSIQLRAIDLALTWDHDYSMFALAGAYTAHFSYRELKALAKKDRLRTPLELALEVEIDGIKVEEKYDADMRKVTARNAASASIRDLLIEGDISIDLPIIIPNIQLPGEGSTSPPQRKEPPQRGEHS